MFKTVMVLMAMAMAVLGGCSVGVYAEPTWHPRPHYRVPQRHIGGAVESCGALAHRISVQCDGNRTCMRGLLVRHQVRVWRQTGVMNHCQEWWNMTSRAGWQPHYRAPRPRPRYTDRRRAPRRRHR